MPRWILTLFGVALVYFLTAELGLTLAFAHSHVSPVWPPTGIAIGAVLIFGYRIWPAIVMGVIALNLYSTAPYPWLVNFGLATGNTLEALLAVWLFRRFSGQSDFLYGPRKLSWFLLTGTISCGATSALIGVFSLCAGGMAAWSSFGELWMTWTIGDAMGLLIVTPFVASLPQAKFDRKPLKEAAKDLLIVAGLILVCQFSFSDSLSLDFRMYPKILLLMPALLIAACHFKAQGTTFAVLCVSIYGVWRTVNGLGPFAHKDLNIILLTTQVSFGIIAVTTLFTFTMRQRQLRTERILLEDRELLKKVIEDQEDERRELAYDLHDGFVQYVIGARSKFEAFLGNLGPISRGESLLKDGISNLGKAIREARHVISDLNPVALDELGVVRAIEMLIDERREYDDLDVDLTLDISFDRLDPKLETVIFRIIQESLTNVARHSKARHATVKLVQEDQWLSIEIADEGIGFVPALVSLERFGLRGIRERADLYGGKAEIDSQPGQGTRIKVSLPIHPSPANGSGESSV